MQTTRNLPDNASIQNTTGQQQLLRYRNENEREKNKKNTNDNGHHHTQQSSIIHDKQHSTNEGDMPTCDQY